MKVHDVIQAHRRQIVELMQQWTRFKEEETESDLSFALMVESELIRLGALVRWLDIADQMVKSAPKKSAKDAGPKLRRRVVIRP